MKTRKRRISFLLVVSDTLTNNKYRFSISEIKKAIKKAIEDNYIKVVSLRKIEK